MHKILERQIMRLYGSVEQFPPEHQALLDVVGKTYSDYEREYALMERSLNISSRELKELNEKMRLEISETKDKRSELESFNKLMIDRELKMIELKETIQHLQRELENK